jgi:DNA-binding transcriptional LysR family regulator
VTFEQMRIFLEAAHFGSFTHAAERLGLTQSAVSICIKKLEERHDVALFDRSGRRLLLTEAGQVLLNEAERILRDVELTIQRVESRRPLDRSTIVACTSNAYNFWLAELVSRDAADQVKMSLIVGDLDEVAAWVMRGTADVGITNVLPSHPQFRQVRVFTDRVILCGSAERANCLPEKFAWTYLTEQSPVLWELSDLSPTIVAALTSKKLDARRLAHPKLKLASSVAVISALRGGRYIGFVPERAATASLASGGIRRIGQLEIPVPYWSFALRERQLEPFAEEIAKAATLAS